MNNLAISIKNLCKVYRIDPATGNTASQTLQEDLMGLVKRPLRRLASSVKQEVWALKDISFDVRAGEVVGLIGRNGAGKSTLLKVLSRITEPTSGYADIFGRVGSLLEVGTGFHTELTGRENIYLSGAILGMRKIEIDRKFDLIVDFSGVGKYIETPVKRYSSGMAVRLAFAVAAHLDPEILLVDEVLAVGDAAFQKKCLGKMGEVAEGGRTVVFVSHNMAAITSLCKRGVWLEEGCVQADGPVRQVVQDYLVMAGELDETKTNLASRTDRGGDGRLRFTEFQVRNRDGAPLSSAVSGEPVDLVLSYQAQGDIFGTTSIHFWICDAFGKCLISLSSLFTGEDLVNLPARGQIALHVPRFPLREGRYFVDLGADIDGVKADRVLKAIQLDVTTGAYYPVQQPAHPKDGDFLIEHSWRLLE
ncbi:MAG: ABC transporter ATP-binding protein [Chloroflexi bacterium]|nr:ABC transporter ATP-binding protein [Chloroflexota bacterium]